MDKIIIRDLAARGIIGVNAWERNDPQDILINLEIYTDTRKTAQTDDLSFSVDYSKIVVQTQHHAENAHRMTVEALADDLARICLKYRGVEKVMVRVEKPGAVRFCAAVGVEIIRTRKEYHTDQ